MIRTSFSAAATARLLFSAVALSVPLAALGQAQPPRLGVYSDDFGGGNAAAASSASRGTTIPVDVDVLEEFEDQTLVLEERMQAHVDDAGAHRPHSHPAHRDSDGVISVPTADAGGGHGPLLEMVAEVIALLLPLAEAQTQPPPLVVYDEDMTGPSSTAPTTSRTDLNATLDVDIPLIDIVRNLIARLDRELTVHVAARPGHAHSHPHSH